MAAFRLVNDDRAGPQALGLLVPPGRRSLVIVRPRSLPWDLLIVHCHRRTGPTTTFRDFGREEAAAAVEGLCLALQEWAAGGPGRVEAVPAANGDGGFLVRGAVGIFPLLTCLRRPGQPYQPLVFPDRPGADEAAAALTGVLCPAADAEQELYMNTRHFAR
jgi:hypothetical protein